MFSSPALYSIDLSGVTNQSVDMYHLLLVERGGGDSRAELQCTA